MELVGLLLNKGLDDSTKLTEDNISVIVLFGKEEGGKNLSLSKYQFSSVRNLLKDRY